MGFELDLVFDLVLVLGLLLLGIIFCIGKVRLMVRVGVGIDLILLVLLFVDETDELLLILLPLFWLILFLFF